MKIKGVEFAGAITPDGGAVPGELPQVAFSGRSNVGKSSLINRMLGRTRTPIARTSKTPGRTQEIHFYRVRAAMRRSGEAAFFLVDLPGYGYAHVPDEVRDRWGPLIESYFSGARRLRGAVQLIDGRHEPTEQDRDMVAYLAALGLPTLIALTKIDKVTRSRRRKHTRRTMDALGVGEEQVVVFSAKTGEGTEPLLDSLEALLERAD